jgi:hypothetical protein
MFGMGKSDPDAPSSSRKRQLNVIYFVDSARTRSFALPLSRLNVILFGALALLTWSVAAIFLIVWLTKDREEVASQLRQSMATVFEYEARHDNAYDIAYPPPGKASSSAAKVAAAPTPDPAAETAPESTSPAAAAAASTTAAASSAQAKAKEEEDDSETSNVSVSNPVLSAGSNALELQFDLTNKSVSERAEGYVWAVAEFRTDQGERIFIGAPGEIQVQEDGEPKLPTKSASFNIRRFKKKGFTFPFVKGKPGMFTGIRIGVMDRSGEDRTTYNVPVEIRVGKRSANDGTSEAKTDESKSG